MRIFVLLCLASVVGFFTAGCAQMHYSGRYQEVRIESEPPGATVLIEGEISTLSPVALQTGGGSRRVYHSGGTLPVELTTPVVLILDKECAEYRLKVVSEGYPEYEKTLSTRFAFHPYLVVLFPLVPFWSDYEIKRFDDVFVDFEEYKAQLETNRLPNARKAFEEAKAALKKTSKKLEEVEAQLEEKMKETAEAEGATSQEEIKKLRELRSSVLKLQSRMQELVNERRTAEITVENLRKEYGKLQEEEKAKQARKAEKESAETEAEGDQPKKAED